MIEVKEPPIISAFTKVHKHTVYVIIVWFSEMVGAAIASDEDFQAIAGIGIVVALLVWVRS